MSSDNSLISYIGPVLAWGFRVLITVGVVFLFAVYFDVSWNDIKDVLFIILEKITL